MANEYGVVLYDVPTASGTLYRRIFGKLRRRALRINLSVWLFPWGQKSELEALIEEAKQLTGQAATFNIIKFDSSDEARLREMAMGCLAKEVSDTAKRIKERVAKARITCKDVPDRYVRETEKRLEIAEGLALMFAMTEDVRDVMEAAKKVFLAEVDALKAEREERFAKARGEGTAPVTGGDVRKDQ